jgi:hypothetical protein
MFCSNRFCEENLVRISVTKATADSFVAKGHSRFHAKEVYLARRSARRRASTCHAPVGQIGLFSTILVVVTVSIPGNCYRTDVGYIVITVAIVEWYSPGSSDSGLMNFSAPRIVKFRPLLLDFVKTGANILTDWPIEAIAAPKSMLGLRV